MVRDLIVNDGIRGLSLGRSSREGSSWMLVAGRMGEGEGEGKERSDESEAQGVSGSGSGSGSGTTIGWRADAMVFV